MRIDLVLYMVILPIASTGSIKTEVLYKAGYPFKEYLLLEKVYDMLDY